ncbi:MAG: small ribosomal subunit biogenesis GTPase RsgA [Gammaproteobacteria bacterium]
MARRRLTRRQRDHVRRIQERRLARARQRAQSLHEAAENQPLGHEEVGRVIANFGASLIVENSRGEALRCVPRANLELLVCGDRVVFQTTPTGDGVVTALMPRDTLLTRPDSSGQPKPLAANIDRIVVVVAVQPKPDLFLLDRYLVAAELLAIPSLIIVNKIDLADEQARRQLEGKMRYFERLGYPWRFVSTRLEHGLDTLFAELADHTSIFVGQSGVGKSSLIKAVIPDREIRIGELSEASGQGRHTTTTTTLYHLPTGGEVIDSPGVREFGLQETDPLKIARGFVDMRPFIGQCRFRDCRHRGEPGCALREAAEAGKIDPRRLESYHRIVGDL